jgi:predicted dehydrogenase
MEFVNGANGTLEVSTACQPGYPMTLELTGTKGSVILKAETIERWSFVDERPEDEVIRKELDIVAANSGGASAAMDFDYRGHMYHVDNLARAIRNGEELMLSGKDGRLAVEFIQAVYESSRTGASVTLR